MKQLQFLNSLGDFDYDDDDDDGIEDNGLDGSDDDDNDGEKEIKLNITSKKRKREIAKVIRKQEKEKEAMDEIQRFNETLDIEKTKESMISSNVSNDLIGSCITDCLSLSNCLTSA